MDIHTLIAIIIIVSLVLCFLLLNIFQYKKSTIEKRAPFLFLLFLTFCITVLPIIILSLLIFIIYRSLLSLILKIKYGSEFRGLLNGADAIFAVEGAKHVVNILIICEMDERRYLQSPCEVLRQGCYKLFDPERYPKFLYSFHKFMGYFFMLKNESVTPDECIKQMKVVEGRDGKLNKEDVMRLVTDCSNAPLPKNGTILWEILIGTQPVNWNSNNSETKSYPVMFRVHHSIADGVSLLKLLVGGFADNPKDEFVFPEEYKEKFVQQELHKNIKRVNCCKADRSCKGQILGFWEHLQEMLDVFLLTVVVLWLGCTTFFHHLFVKGKDYNFLQGPLLSGQLLLALKAEVSAKYVEKIKIIKSKVPGTAFSDVVLTAFSASLNEYFLKNSASYPRYITTLLPVFSGSTEIRQLTPGDYDINLENKFSMLYLNLPLYVKDEDDDSTISKPVLKRLEMLKAETSALKNSFDYKANHWILSVFLPLFPHAVIKSFLYLPRCTIFASILPGPPKITVCGGSPLQECAFWVPHLGHTGVTISILTYDGRLQLGLKVDKALISDANAADSILNGVFKFIDILDDETSERVAIPTVGLSESS